MTLSEHTDTVRFIIELKCGGIIASASDDKSIKIWDLSSPKASIITLIEHTDCVRSLVELKCGKIASASYDKSIKIWK